MARNPTRLEQLAKQLLTVATELEGARAAEAATGGRALVRVRESIDQAAQRLRELLEQLATTKTPGFVFDPASPDVAGRVVALALLMQDPKPLADADQERFYGSGVYALYYRGSFDAYRPLAGKDHPLYVGKAEPDDPTSTTPRGQGERLSRRVREHRRTIAAATTTLDLADFAYRALVVASGHEGAAEKHLIRLFKPIWNSETKICYGFGKHGDAPTTRANLRSPWDTLHPARAWATTPPARSTKEIRADIAHHLTENPPYSSLRDALHAFLETFRAPR
ncbi:MAG: hypothetical protein AMXMBFR36_38400 [Acidobacteriota bacterium]